MARKHLTEEYRARMSEISKANWAKRRGKVEEMDALSVIKKENSILRKENKVIPTLKDEVEKLQQALTQRTNEVMELRKKVGGPSLERLEKMIRTSQLLSEFDEQEQLLVTKLARSGN